jgi:hypothetical protein
MNKKKATLVVLLILLLVAGFALWHQRPVPTTVSVSLTGTAGLKVAGTVIVDGMPREFSGVLPTNITVEARTFEYTIVMQEPRGELSAKLTTVGGLYAGAGAANDFSGVRGHYSHTWGGRSASANTTNPISKAQ